MEILNSAIPKLSLEWKTWIPACAWRGCSRRVFLCGLTRRRYGVSLGERWCCSAACFQALAEEEMRGLLADKTFGAAVPKPRIPLGLLLLSRGHIDEQQLRLALKMQRDCGGLMGDIVQQLGFASEEQVTYATAAQWGYPVFPIQAPFPSVESVRLPEVISRHYAAIPLHFAHGTRKLLLGFVHNVDHLLVRTLESMVPCLAMPCFVVPSAWRRCVEATQPARRDSEMSFDHVMSTAEMARIVTSYSVQIGASQVRMARCRDHVWVRLQQQEREMDMVFRCG